MNTQRLVIKSPIHLASIVGDLAGVESAVQQGAGVDKARKDDGATRLLLAAAAGHLAIV
jgi:hypothetical protein